MSTLASIQAWFRKLDTKSFHAVACQGNEPSEADIVAFERDAGFRLPTDFRKFTMSPLGGLYLEVNRAIWPVFEEYTVAPAWTFRRGLMVFGIAKGIPPWLDLRVQLERVRGRGIAGLVPFFQIESDADRYCFDRKGEIWLLDHEEPSHPRAVGFTFPELLMEEIAELSERKTEYERLAAAQATQGKGRSSKSATSGKSPAKRSKVGQKPAKPKKKPVVKTPAPARGKAPKKKAPSAKRATPTRATRRKA